MDLICAIEVTFRVYCCPMRSQLFSSLFLLRQTARQMAGSCSQMESQSSNDSISRVSPMCVVAYTRVEDTSYYNCYIFFIYI
jgi:hypothetical protein